MWSLPFVDIFNCCLHRLRVKMMPNQQLLIPVATLWSQTLLDPLVTQDAGFNQLSGLFLHPPRCPSSTVWRLWVWRVMRKRRRTTWVWIAFLRGRESVWRKGRVSRDPVSPQPAEVRHLSRTQTKRRRDQEPLLSLDSVCSTALLVYPRAHPSIRLWATPDPNSPTTTLTSCHLRTAIAPGDADHGQFPLGIFTFHFPLAQQTSSPETQEGQGWELAWKNLCLGPLSWQQAKMWVVSAGAETASPTAVVLVQSRRPSVPFVPQPPVLKNAVIIWCQGFAGAATRWIARCVAPVPEQNTWTAARRGFLASWLELHGCLPAGALLQPL